MKGEVQPRNLARILPQSAVLIFDSAGRHLIVEGGATVARLGLAAEDLLNKTLPEALPEMNLKKLVKAYQAALRGKASHFELSWNSLTLDVQILPIKGEVPSPFMGIAILQEITDILASRETLRINERRLRASLDNLPLGICRNSPYGRGEFMMANPTFLKMFGIESEEMLSRFAAADFYFNERDRQKFSDLLLESREVRSLLMKLRRLDGTILWGSISSRVAYDDKGKPAYFDNVIEDITPRIEAESAYRILAEHSLQALLILQNNRVVFANPAVTMISGYSFEDLLTLSPFEALKLIHVQDRKSVYQSFHNLVRRKERKNHLTGRIVRKDGGIRWIETVNVEVEFQGKPALQLAFVDITEQREAQEKLQRRLAMETMISSISTRFIDLPLHQVDAEIIEALGEVGRFAGADDCFLSFLGLPGTDLQAYYHWRAPHLKPREIHPRGAEFLTFEWVQKELEDQHYLSIPALQSIPDDAKEAKSFFSSLGINSILISSLSSPNKLDGFLAVDMEGTERIWQDEAIQLLQMAGEVFLNMLQRRYAEESLRKSESQYRLLADSIQDVIGLHNLDGATYYFSPSFQKLTGIAVNELVDWNIFEFIAPRSENWSVDKIRQELLAGRDLIFDWQIQRANGRVLWIETHMHPIAEEGSQPGQWISSSRDVTERREVREELRAANISLQETVERLGRRNKDSGLLIAMGDMLQSCLTLEEVYDVARKYCQKLFSSFSGALYLHEEPARLARKVVSWGESELSPAFTKDNCWALRRGRVHVYKNSSDLICRHVDRAVSGDYFCIPLVALGETVGLFHLSNLTVGANDHTYQFAVMVAERIALAIVNLRLRETLRNQSVRDPLTELYNRRYLLETMQRELSRATRRKTEMGIMMMDIDHFKIFNDSYGHPAGDVLLQSLGSYLLKNVRGEDVACRYGGEEFVVILPDTNFADAIRRADEFRDGISRLAVLYGGKTLGGITVSIGVSSFPQHGKTMEELLRNADLALYRAKNEGRDRVARPHKG